MGYFFVISIIIFRTLLCLYFGENEYGEIRKVSVCIKRKTAPPNGVSVWLSGTMLRRELPQSPLEEFHCSGVVVDHERYVFNGGIAILLEESGDTLGHLGDGFLF